MDTPIWLGDLNPQQRRAVTGGDGPLLVIAGAGTGKTKTLACRVAWLIHKGVDPDRILLLTFTRRAAAEMLKRAGQLVDASIVGRVWGGTFHAVANRLLRVYGQALDLPPEFTIMDQSDAADMMNLLRAELELAKGDKRFPRKETLAAIYSRSVNAREKLADTLEVFYPWCSEHKEDIARIFREFQDRKKQQNVLDYDDLLLFLNALAQEPGVGDALGDRFEHVLVDEYQDTNLLQSEILLGLRRRQRNIMVVGDDAQSIYSFRAATVRNILDFPQQFSGAEIVTLEQNYRSVQPILHVSNAVMAHAKERYTKELWSSRVSSRKPSLVYCRDEPDQCQAVVHRILEHLEAGIPLRQQAVLFRAGHHSSVLEVELTRRKIPFHKYGGLRFIETAHIKDMLAMLRILENPYDQLSWHRVLLMLPGVGPSSARRIMDDLWQAPPEPARTNGHGAETPVQSPLLAMLERAPRVPAGSTEHYEKLRQTLRACCGIGAAGKVRKRKPEPPRETRGQAPPPIATQIEILRRYYEPLCERMHDNARMRLKDLEQLEQIASGYRSRQAFITDLTLDPPHSTSDLAGAPYLEEDYLILSTIHSAKGCEWDVVHVLHAADGMIPSDMSTGDSEGVDEERRLLYVALTRAKDFLYVYFPLRYYHAKYRFGAAHNFAKLSRFITKSVLTHFEQTTTPQGDGLPHAAGEPADPRKRMRELWG
ncbi:MAG: ATP-dependent helicase [Phycisphaerales bacterium]|nr:ATP-dependent helicase [Phycisphaerales bacterium]